MNRIYTFFYTYTGLLSRQTEINLFNRHTFYTCNVKKHPFLQKKLSKSFVLIDKAYIFDIANKRKLHIKKVILSQKNREKHYFFLIKTLVVCILLSITVNEACAQALSGKKEDAKAETISFKERWGIKTNAVDWLLTIPNIGVEFDLGNTIRNKHTVSANLKWNWNTSQKYKPSIVFNLFDARVEWRQYFRTRPRYTSTTLKDGFIKYLNDNIFTTKRKTPRDWRAYYWGVYAHASSYNFKLGKQGTQGNAYGAGISLGYTAPLYGYRNNYVDLELGGSIGMVYTNYDVYEHDAESDCYPRIANKCKEGHIMPFPLITDLRVAFVYRFVSVKDKYKKSINRRSDIRDEKRNKLNEVINKMHERIDSISSACKKQGIHMSDSLLNKEEQREWRKMQEEAQLKAQEEAALKLKRQIADSLGIQLSDTVPLTKAQQKAMRDAEKAIKEKKQEPKEQKEKKKTSKKDAQAAEEAAAKTSETPAETAAETSGVKEKKEKEKKTKEEKPKKEKKPKKDKKESAKEEEGKS